MQQASSLVDLTRIFASKTQVCVHPRPGSPDMLGALESVQASGWAGLRAVVRLCADGVPAIDALPLPPPVAHPALRRELALCVEAQERRELHDRLANAGH